MASNRPTDKDSQEKALYDIIQYLPLDSIDINNYDSINNIVNNTIKKGVKWEKTKDSLSKKEREEIESAQKAISENLPAIKAILKDRPELGKAKISNMSWKDNDGDDKMDHNPEGMQACTFERDDQVYISFRGTPKRAWIDNAKGFVRDLNLLEVVATVFKLVPDLSCFSPSIMDNSLLRSNTGEIVEVLGKLGEIASKNLMPQNDISTMDNESDVKLNNIFDQELYKYTSPMQEEALAYMKFLNILRM